MTDHIRNFCIIAHVDHGKSTLADRLLQLTGAISEREMTEQVLDSMDLEREKGVTIKASAVRMYYTAQDSQRYEINLIDTPGHVDFGYEVSRALKACEGAVLVVDATQGIEAQTLANLYQALDADLTIIPVINKIDLPSARPDEVAEDVGALLGIDPLEVIQVSAKEGVNVDQILEAIVTRVPPPKDADSVPLRALIFDSHYDSYKGVIAYVRVFEGMIRSNEILHMFATQADLRPVEIGIFAPSMKPVQSLGSGEVGYIATGLKTVHECRVGDTITSASAPASAPLPGYRHPKPMVFAGIYPVEADDYSDLREALDKLQLNDASLTFQPETSQALGFGFRCGFLGLLHMDIVRERLEREFALSLITTAATVVYQVITTGGETLLIDNPLKLPPESDLERIEEPVIQATLHLPQEFLGGVLGICEEKRGAQKEIRYLGPKRVLLVYELPLNEIVVDFYDRLKSVSRGYASMDYEIAGYRPADLVKLDVRINGEIVDAMSMIVHRDKAYYRGRDLVQRMRELIPRQLFEVVIQAAIGSRVIARESVKPLRKNVTAKCYGGDITRKRKLLERQREGKKRMKQVGKVEIPQEAFLAALKV